MKLIGKYVTLTKERAVRYTKGNHPNGIEVGSKIAGFAKEEPEEGMQWYLYPSLKFGNLGPSAWTSVVVNIDFQKMEIRTMNSVYKIEINEDLDNK